MCSETEGNIKASLLTNAMRSISVYHKYKRDLGPKYW